MTSVDMSQIPLAALSAESRQMISVLLNPPKVIPAFNGGLLRDWRGLSQLSSIGSDILPSIAADPDPTERIFTILQKRPEVFSLLDLQYAFETIERWDIIDDTRTFFERDGQLHLQRLQRSHHTAPRNNFPLERDVLTTDDLYRIERGEGRQHYDAFLLYADEDAAFAMEVVEQLEKRNNVKLCLKDRDLITGVSFQHEAIIRLISERCNRLITILSPAFSQSPENTFFINFAQASGIDRGQERKIIPVVYKYCDIPPSLAYYTKIYYTRLSSELFWNKLLSSVVVTSAAYRTVQREQISEKTEIANPTPEQSTSQSYQNGAQAETEEIATIEMHNRTVSRERPRYLIMGLRGSRVFPFVKNRKVTAPDPTVPVSLNVETSIDLPSVDGVDSLTSSMSQSEASDSDRKKKSKKKYSFMRKWGVLRLSK